MTEVWTVYVRDNFYRRVAQLEQYTALDMTLRFNDVSTFTLTMSARHALASTLLQKGYGIQVYCGSRLILGGDWSKTSYHYGDSTDEVTVSGEDDTVWMKRRNASPRPATADQVGVWKTTGVVDDTIGSGFASSYITYFAQRNLGLDAMANRKVAPTTSTTSFGTQAVQRARWQNLLTLCQEIAAGGAINGIEPGFRIAQVGDALQLQVYQPTDRTADVKLSPTLGNVRELTYEQNAPEATAVYVGGSGDDDQREYIVRTSPEVAVWGRREADLANASNTNVLAELEVEAAKVLADKGYKVSLSVVPDPNFESTQFGVHYFVGDKVTAILNQLGPDGALKAGDTITDVLREATIRLTEDGVDVTTTVGSNGTGFQLVKLFGFVRRLGARLTDIERN